MMNAAADFANFHNNVLVLNNVPGEFVLCKYTVNHV